MEVVFVFGCVVWCVVTASLAPVWGCEGIFSDCDLKFLQKYSSSHYGGCLSLVLSLASDILKLIDAHAVISWLATMDEVSVGFFVIQVFCFFWRHIRYFRVSSWSVCVCVFWVSFLFGCWETLNTLCSKPWGALHGQWWGESQDQSSAVIPQHQHAWNITKSKVLWCSV